MQITSNILDKRHIRPKGVPSNEEFQAFSMRINANFNYIVAKRPAIFKVADFGIWEEYLRLMPSDARQYHNCNCCKNFIERFGLLVCIEDGALKSLIWDENTAPDFYQHVVARLRKKVEAQMIERQFFIDEAKWGVANSNGWNHFNVIAPHQILHHDLLKTPFQAEAEQLEEYRIMKEAVAEYNHRTASKAVDLLHSAGLYRAERIMPQAKWFMDVLGDKRVLSKSHKTKSTILWDYVAAAPKGWCHIKNSVVGTILDDIVRGASIDAIRRSVRDKMDPLQYQRPTAAPTEGNVRRADEIIDKLNLRRSFERRFATIDDVTAIWKPQMPNVRSDSFFGHVLNERKDKQTFGNEAITWARFRRSILPNAVSIKVQIPSSGPYCAMTTAVHEDAHPIIQWDHPGDRNPVAWYFYSGGSTPSQWGLRSQSWVDVEAVIEQPNMRSGASHQGEQIMFALKGAADTRNNSLALFPEILKSELREIRSTIEAYSRSGTLKRPRGQLASGLMTNFNNHRITVMVDHGSFIKHYTIDRWD